MRSFILSILIISSFKSIGQTYTLSNLENVLSQDVCQCLNQNKFTDFYDTKTLSTCLDKTISKNKTLIMKTIQKVYGDTSSATGYEAGHDVYNLVTYNLITVCDRYYSSLVDSREKYFSKFKDYDKDSIRGLINLLKLKSQNLRNADYYKIRAANYFDMDDLTNAKLDLDSVESLENRSLYALYLRAEIAEYSADFDNAIQYYSEFAIRMKNSTYKQFALMLERKKNNK